MNPTENDYGLWPMVILNSAFFIFFAFSFFKPQSRRDWRTLGLYSGFIVALFTEMYGFPLTIYFLSGWLTDKFPGVNWLAHDSGHLLEMMFGWRGNPHFGPFHMLSILFIGGGFWLLSASWPVLYRAVQHNELASSGPYARIRHPQYVAFLLVMFGFLLQWPTLITVLMFPVLLIVYVRLARAEEREAAERFGAQWREYASHTPGFIPQLTGLTQGSRK
ncbi:MAG: isoprenylcysteine carboxylmethyltransferase family protein [Gallionella sp.]|jgi:protein-S-isoprenylcysteine O-methyltransferase Ste14|nr:isoprenylcysteine carboxylmethyltransferase family protein [Gallionella sp.]